MWGEWMDCSTLSSVGGVAWICWCEHEKMTKRCGVGCKKDGRVVKHLQYVVERASHLVWIKRDDDSWLQWRWCVLNRKMYQSWVKPAVIDHYSEGSRGVSRKLLSSTVWKSCSFFSWWLKLLIPVRGDAANLLVCHFYILLPFYLIFISQDVFC